jgi:hypothetical protein
LRLCFQSKVMAKEQRTTTLQPDQRIHPSNHTVDGAGVELRS